MSNRHDIILRVTAEGYAVADDAGHKQHSKLPVGSLVGARIARSRSLPQQRMYWAVLATVVDATGQWRTPEELHLAIKFALGYVNPVLLTSGRRIIVPESTSFDSMNHEEFCAFTEAAYRLICDEIMGGMSLEELLDEAQAA